MIPVWKEPIPGWTDNINGPTGLLIGAGKGVIRTMYCNENGYADYLPVDIAVNAILVSSWNFLYCKETDKRVYNLTSSSDFKVTVVNLKYKKKIEKLLRKYLKSTQEKKFQTHYMYLQ